MQTKQIALKALEEIQKYNTPLNKVRELIYLHPDKKLILAAVKRFPSLFRELSLCWRNDLSIAKEAIRQDSSLLAYASSSIKNRILHIRDSQTFSANVYRGTAFDRTLADGFEMLQDNE